MGEAIDCGKRRRGSDWKHRSIGKNKSNKQLQFRFPSGKVLLLTLSTNEVINLCADNDELKANLNELQIIQRPDLFSTFYHTLSIKNEYIMSDIVNHLAGKIQLTDKEVKVKDKYEKMLQKQEILNKSYDPYVEGNYQIQYSNKQ